MSLFAKTNIEVLIYYQHSKQLRLTHKLTFWVSLTDRLKTSFFLPTYPTQLAIKCFPPKISFYLPTYPIFYFNVTGNTPIILFGLRQPSVYYI
jgi:hypothetical protein